MTKPGRHSDGGGLYLVVDKGGARRWAFLFRWHGKLKEMGLGGIQSVSLADARQAAARVRQVLADGRNPIEDRRRAQAAISFGEMADQLVASLAPGWRNAKHVAQWKMTLDVYAKPLRALAVDRVTTEDVLQVLKPIWATKPETASRLRGRIERVLDAAKTLGHRSGENPAAWRGHLRNLLPNRQKLTRGHHAALPFAGMAEFMVRLRKHDGVAARALEFTILTAVRTSETLKAQWSEFDLPAKVWTVPGIRTKSGREHRVPLSAGAMAILKTMQDAREDEVASAYVFPGQYRRKPLSNMSMDMLLRRMARKGDPEVTVHGFRSTFRDWAGERSTFPREIAEAALAHLVGDETERAYRRGDALEKRRELMDTWAAFCSASPAEKVVPIRRRP